MNKLPILGTLVLLGIFVGNMVLGATGGTPFLGDVAEALILFACAVVFVITVLQAEAQNKK